MDIEGRGILITGASRGLGQALARELARRGGKVALVARNEAALRDAVASIRAEGGDAHAVPGDVGDKDTIHRISGAAAALVGPIEVLIQNASTLGPVPLRPLLDTDCEDLERAFAVNALGPFRLAKAVAGPMVVRRNGTIVWIGSDAAIAAYETWGAYGATKATADHLARTFAAELAASSVRSFVVDPGEMDTRMHEEAFGPSTTKLARPEDVAARIASLIADPVAAPSGARVVVEGT